MQGKQLRKAYFEAYFEFGLITEHSCGDVLENPKRAKLTQDSQIEDSPVSQFSNRRYAKNHTDLGSKPSIDID